MQAVLCIDLSRNGIAFDRLPMKVDNIFKKNHAILPASKQIPQVATHWAFVEEEGAEEKGINLETAKDLFSSSDPKK